MGFDVALLYVNSWLHILESTEHSVIFANNVAACNSHSASLHHRLEKEVPWVKTAAPFVSLTVHLHDTTVTYHTFPHISLRLLLCKCLSKHKHISLIENHFAAETEGFGTLQRLITKSKKYMHMFSNMVIKIHSHINTASIQLQCNGGELTVTMR